jgi:hypothetical protein
VASLREINDINTSGGEILTLATGIDNQFLAVQIKADVPKTVYLSGFVAQIGEAEGDPIEIRSIPVKFGLTFFEPDPRFTPYDVIYTPRDGFRTPSTISLFRLEL